MSPEAAAKLEEARARAKAKTVERAAVQAPAPEESLAIGSRAGGNLPRVSQGEAGVRGFARGASFGALPAISGVYDAIIGGAAKLPGVRPALAAFVKRSAPAVMELGDAEAEAIAQQLINDSVRETTEISDPSAPVSSLYAQSRDEAQRRQRAADAQWPKTSLGASLAGGLAVPLPFGGGIASKVAQRAVQGAASGGINAALESPDNLIGEDAPVVSDREPSIVRDTLRGATVGAVAGPILGGAAERGGAALRRILRRSAEESALKAMGLRAGISSQLKARGYGSADDARQLGRAALESGIVPFGAKAEGVAKAAGEAQQRYGALIGGAIQDADAAATFDWGQATQDAAKALDEANLTTTAARQADKARALLADVAESGVSRPQTFAEANRLKSDMYKGIDYGVDPGLSHELQRRVPAGLRRSIEEQVAATAGDDAAEALRTGNQGWGVAEDVLGLASEEAGRQLERQTPLARALKLLPLMVGGGTGTAVGTGAGLAGTAAAFGVDKLLPRLPSMSAHAADAAANVVPPATDAASRALQTWIRQRAAQSQPKDTNNEARDSFLRNGL